MRGYHRIKRRPDQIGDLVPEFIGTVRYLPAGSTGGRLRGIPPEDHDAPDQPDLHRGHVLAAPNPRREIVTSAQACLAIDDGRATAHPGVRTAARDWSRFFTSMVVSVIAITDAVLPGMRERRWGRIITNTSSTSSGVVAPIPNLGLSNALRASLVAWSKTLAREVGERNITSNIVVPGRVATSRMVRLDEAKAAREGRPAAEITAGSVASIPLGRYGDPRE